jgi:hypothetical protein
MRTAPKARVRTVTAGKRPNCQHTWRFAGINVTSAASEVDRAREAPLAVKVT